MDNNWNTNGNQGQMNGQNIYQPYQPEQQYQQYQPEQQYQPYQPEQQYQPYRPVQPPVVDETVKISEYLLPLLLCQFIPCAGIILLIVYACSSSEKESKKNFCKAYLISVGISIALVIILLIIYTVIFAAALG